MSTKHTTTRSTNEQGQKKPTPEQLAELRQRGDELNRKAKALVKRFNAASDEEQFRMSGYVQASEVERLAVELAAQLIVELVFENTSSRL